MTRNGCQLRPDITMRGSASGTMIIPASLRLNKCCLRCEPDVVDQVKLPTALAFAVAAQIHVSHGPKIIKPQGRQPLPNCHQRPIFKVKLWRSNAHLLYVSNTLVSLFPKAQPFRQSLRPPQK